ncbi:bifunctional 3-(3-hydroxy-phenyl)propionate/3-hydroxycinnamic acid hydroxylase [Pseudooceanicola sp. MF1-13]|uniref:bifunctional 3-(3-hydroxy-phenyl)propionate/3-hydroxycinnamic acid hydroxylase n=1 Tax=Pseudooceanicola sp. MF1-13 TaxID=3379095 RepID=UPI003891F9FD
MNTEYDIIQIGYGPVSKVSALILARMGWKVGIFERFHDVYPLPRAVCIDHEMFRMLHAVGLGDIADKVTEPSPVYRWFNSDWKELLAIDWTDTSVSGGLGTNFVHQPSFEREMHAAVVATEGVDLFLETECIALSQDESKVTVTVRDVKSGQTRDVTGKYLLGVDGANSFVRESLGISRTDKGFEADWLVVDFALNDGLTARQLGLVECGQFCNPTRPTTIVPGGTDENGRVCRRWEFMRLPHETREEMNERAKVEELLGDWIKPEQGELVRHAVYTFRSLIADKWREGRVILAGDAAHLMPPFMGQGMCSGMRDIWNLAWKLDPVLRGEADPAILDTYGPERLPHVSDVVDMSIFLGSIICIPDQAAAAERDEMFLSGNAPPPADFPILTNGFIETGADGAPVGSAGDIGPHGHVRHKGRTARFDAFVVPGFNVILSPEVDINAISARSRAVIEALGGQIVTMHPRETATDDQIADTQGQFLSWMGARGIKAIVTRPDFYLFGAADSLSRLEEVIAALDAQATHYGLRGKAPMKEAVAV